MARRADFVTAARAKTLVQLVRNELAGANPDLERTERVAHAAGTDRQRALVWLRHILDFYGTRLKLLKLGFDKSVVDAAGTLVQRERESLREYAQRVAACPDTDVLAVALAAIDDEMREEVEYQRDRLAAYEEGRRALQRAVDAQPPGDPPPAGRVGDDCPPADLSGELLALADHTDGAQDAMRHMLEDPARGLRGSLERLSPDDRELLVGNLHDLLQVVGVLVFDVTAREDENPHEDRMALAKARTRGADPVEGLETMALRIAHRLREFNEAHRGDEPENGEAD